MTRHKSYSPQDAPPEMLALAAQLIPLLLGSDHPAISALRQQYKVAQVVSVETDIAGYFINYEVPADAPRTVPEKFAGGDAHIVVAGFSAPAGCVLFVRDGRLAQLEVYTNGDDWPEHAQVLAVKDVFPLMPPKGVLQ